MSQDPYNPRVRALFADLVHTGELPDAAMAESGDQGLFIRLFAQHEGDDITAMRFLVDGCPHVIAAAEVVCREFSGSSAARLAKFEPNTIMRDLSVPIEKTGRILVLEDALRSLGLAIKERVSSAR